MTSSQRTLALALVLGAYFASTGNPHNQPSHFARHFVERIQTQAATSAPGLSRRQPT